jgi:alginate O-acetyltransferase complex protein AlgJ
MQAPEPAPFESPATPIAARVTSERAAHAAPAAWGTGHIHTEVSRAVAVVLTLCFLLAIAAVPLAQVWFEKARGEPPYVLELFRHAPTRERLREFEEELDKTSDFKDYVQPRLQALLTRFGGAGNKKAVVGSGGFLFYAPGIEHLAGPSFIDARRIEQRERAARDAGQPIHADPRPAIFALRRALAARGIPLLLFPVPDKAMLQPLELHGRGAPSGRSVPARNVAWPAFAAELRSRDVALFDPSPPELVPGEPRRFLIQDTHWTPRWMEEVARRLAEAVRAKVALPPVDPKPAYSVVEEQVERVGDVTDMLKLPEDQKIFLPERVTLRAVKDANGAAWEPDPKADVLLLGDSFTNVFSMDFMGWGAGAGLGPHLSVALGRPVDVIAQNDSGAFATRQALALELAGGTDRLAGKRVVVWEFAVRELSVGDWKPLDYALGAPGATP